jgi:hypothetical protein
MPVADWIKALHADLDARIAAAEAKLASKPVKTTSETETPVTPKKASKAKKTPDAPKKETKEPKSEAVVVEVEKRIKRMSPTLTKQLTAVFEDAKKEFKKENGPEFAKYVNDLTKDAFEAKNLADHMRDYAGVGAAPVAPAAVAESKKKVVKKTPAPEPEPVADEDLVEVTFNKVKYVVGEISKIVYEANDDGDKRVGLLGLGKFAKMQVPPSTTK